MIIEHKPMLLDVINLRDELKKVHATFKDKAIKAENQAEKDMYYLLALTKEDTLLMVEKIIDKHTKDVWNG